MRIIFRGVLRVPDTFCVLHGELLESSRRRHTWDNAFLGSDRQSTSYWDVGSSLERQCLYKPVGNPPDIAHAPAAHNGISQRHSPKRVSNRTGSWRCLPDKMLGSYKRGA